MMRLVVWALLLAAVVAIAAAAMGPLRHVDNTLTRYTHNTTR